MIDISHFNSNQKFAATWPDGPLLILAGPGSGKSSVLTYRVAKLIEETPDKHFKVLALTYTNKAAAEMRERIEKLVPIAENRTKLTTIHSFCADILRQHGHHIGLNPDFSIMTEDSDRYSFVNDTLKNCNIDKSEYSREKILPVLTYIFDNDVNHENVTKFLADKNYPNADHLSRIFFQYRNQLIDSNFLDIPALIAETLNLLRKNEGIRKQIQRVYPYICVDEFQNTSHSQIELIAQIVDPKTRNLFVVADDDQIICHWNGTSIGHIKSLVKKFKMKMHHLPENYRCPESIVGIANNLISHNFKRLGGKRGLIAHKSPGKSPVYQLKAFDEFDHEVNWIADEFTQYDPKSKQKCVILARTRKILDLVVDGLKEKGLKGYIQSTKSEFESTQMQWFHATLRLANSRVTSKYLQRVCKAFYSLEGIELNVDDIVTHANAGEGDYLRSWATASIDHPDISSVTKEFFCNSLLPHLVDRIDIQNFQKEAFSWLDGKSVPKSVYEENFESYYDEKDSWLQLVADISEQLNEQNLSLNQLIKGIDVNPKSRAQPKNSIPCFTIHASKGMEFEHVFFVGLVEDQLPSWAAIKRGKDSLEMQEERGNCFVAITRVQKKLTMTYSRRINGWNKEPSRFLYEMGILKR